MSGRQVANRTFCFQVGFLLCPFLLQREDAEEVGDGVRAAGNAGLKKFTCTLQVRLSHSQR
jgi:hypothetical protein